MPIWSSIAVDCFEGSSTNPDQRLVYVYQGILWSGPILALAWPCGALVLLTVRFILKKGKLIYWAKDSVLEALQGQPVLSPISPLKLPAIETMFTHSSVAFHEVLGGERTQPTKRLRDPRDGTKVSVKNVEADTTGAAQGYPIKQ